MRRWAVILFAALAALACREMGAAPLPQRWVYASNSLGSDEQVAQLEQIINTAADHGLNGLLLSAGFDSLGRKQPDYFPRLERIKALCKRRGIELIPILFSAGYGGGVLGYDRNLAEGLPVVDAPFVVKGGEARIEKDPACQIANGGFEEWDGNRLKDFVFHDKPGEISHPDRDVVHEGKSSIRLERFGELSPEHGHARICQEITVRPHRQYRLQLWAKTQDLEPAGAFRVQVYTEKGVLAPVDVHLPSTSDWRRVEMTFNSGSWSKLRVYAGLWGGKRGTLWLDSLSLEELALYNVLRRPGTPITVRSADGATTYEEGKDYAPIVDPDLLRAHKDPAGLALRLLPGSRIREGDRLLVSYYHAQPIHRGQVTICMSEPKVYDIWREEARLVQQHLAPARWFLSMDEVRAGGTCRACKERGLSMAEILGDCITRQVKLIREVNPKAEVYIWSDMLDPKHNARSNYYLVEGDYTGSWEYVPKDLIIACWHYGIRDESLKFFSEHGFRTLGAAYYDGDDLENCKGWLESLRRTPNAVGIMYTSWRNKYALLGPFGDLVSR
ncbi:MAG: hypothetical protein GX785_13615 [Armatimonadetes bacterium]|nr:hypothetical protein [Armatimonadota bacterium]